MINVVDRAAKQYGMKINKNKAKVITARKEETAMNVGLTTDP